ncbi:MAG: PspC domain-containing protein [Bacteroidales bacterium]|nr:PspC domain-containing protein [Bacteroidales bacterium]
MKKTVKVNIKESIFQIDEDGYEILKKYLDKITDHFKSQEGGQDIIDDIESRIAELFKDRINENKQVINKNDVEKVINIMGTPEEIINEESYSHDNNSFYEKHNRRLYRDPERAILGGICSGLANYFNVDILWIRLFFIILFFINGLGLLLYIILWVVVPAALTTSQRLEMKGEKVTISNIERTIKEEYENVKDNIKKYKNSRSYNTIGQFFEEIGRLIGNLIILIFKIILGIIGISLIIGGLSILIGFISLFIFKISIFPFIFHDLGELYISDILNKFIDPSNLSLFLIALFFTITLPIFSLIYGIIKLVFQFKSNDKIIGTTIFVLWILSACILVSMLFIEGKNFKTHKATYHTELIKNSNMEILFLEVKRKPDYNKKIIWHDDYKILYNENENNIYGKPIIDIEKCEGNNFEIVLKKKAFGENSQDAKTNANNIIYAWNQTDSLIQFDPYFTIPEDEKWRFPTLKIIIKMPEGKTVYLSESLEEYLDDVDNMTNTWEEDMVSKKWIMTKEGLKMLY